MLNFFYRSKKDKELIAVKNLKVGGWLSSTNPNSDIKKQILAITELDSGLLDDATDYFEVPRYELDENILYFFTRYPVSPETHSMSTAPILIAISDTYVATISLEQTKFLNKLKKDPQFYTTQKTKFFIQILKLIISDYSKKMIATHKNIRKVMSSFKKISNEDIEKLVYTENIINDYLGALIPTKQGIEQVLSGRGLTLHEEDEDLVEDLLLESEQIIRSAKSILKNIQNIRDSYSAIVANRLNKIMKTLASLTVILTIPTIVSSIYGMNIELPFMHYKSAFTIITTSIIVVTVIIWGIFAYNDWI